MILSPSSLITIVLLCNLIVLIIWFFLKSYKRIMQIRISALIMVILMMILRLFVPIEFQFQRTIAIKYIFPDLFIFLYTPILQFADIDVCVYHICLVIWGIGLVILVSRMIINYWWFCRLIYQSPCVTDTRLLIILKKTVPAKRKPINFKVIKTNLVSVPIIFGFFHPIILIPEVTLSDSELYYIFKHEVTHYYNHDLYIKLLGELIKIIYWWNPFVYILKQEIDKMLELRVDSSIIKLLNKTEKIEYLECLLKIAKESSVSQIYNFSPAFGYKNVSELSQRFHIILDSDLYQGSRIKNSLLLTSVILIILLASSVVMEPYSINPSDFKKTVELSTETSYLVINPEGGYDIYLNDNYFATVTDIKDSYANLSVYNNLKEAVLYEKMH